jgi:hypothetical protein
MKKFYNSTLLKKGRFFNTLIGNHEKPLFFNGAIPRVPENIHCLTDECPEAPFIVNHIVSRKYINLKGAVKIRCGSPSGPRFSGLFQPAEFLDAAEA